MSLSALLDGAGVSRTAYYSLARRATVLPGSVHAIATALGVPVSTLLDEVPTQVLTARTICKEEPDATFENVWHTLTLLELDAAERLNRSLIRGRTTSLHR